MALGDPEFGYYTTREPFGRGGDFITAPEITQMFGELIGLWAGEVWLSMGAPEDIVLVELGPGRGTLMGDMTRTLARALPAFHEAACVHLVEMSPRLKKEQADALEGENVTWHQSIDTLPDAPLIIIANEFFDALPVHQYVKSGRGWHERHVGLGIGGEAAFGFCLAENPVTEPGVLPQNLRAPVLVETIAEVRPEANALVHQFARRLNARGGVALIIDYGHDRSAFGDTFQAVRNHQPQHVLASPGEADLTAHVDFAALRRAATLSGLSATGVTGQGDFLKALGIQTRAAKLKESATKDQARDIDSALERLTHPDHMGSLFKALAVHSQNLAVPPGFEPARGR